MADKQYRVRRFGSDEFTDVSEQEFLNNLARSHQARTGTLNELGPSIIDEPEMTGDIELRRRASRGAMAKSELWPEYVRRKPTTGKNAPAASAFLKGLSGK